MSIRLDGSVTLEGSAGDGSARIRCWMAHGGYMPVAETYVYADDKARTVLIKNRDGERFALIQTISDEWLRDVMRPDGQFGGWEIVYDLNAARSTDQ